jgi:hypothetical protein
MCTCMLEILKLIPPPPIFLTNYTHVGDFGYWNLVWSAIDSTLWFARDRASGRNSTRGMVGQINHEIIIKKRIRAKVECDEIIIFM